MLQKISDFIKSELQSMLKNRQQRARILRYAFKKIIDFKIDSPLKIVKRTGPTFS